MPCAAIEPFAAVSLVSVCLRAHPAGRAQVDVEDMDEFTRLKKLAARQVLEIRKLIAERDDCLEASSGSSGRQSVMLSSKIREQLKNVKETHDRMQNALHHEEKDRNKGGKALLEANTDEINEHVRIVELTSKHIEECEALEKRRFQAPGARMGGGRPGMISGGSAMGAARGGSGAAGTHPMKDINRTFEATDLDPIDVDPDVGQALAQVALHFRHVRCCYRRSTALTLVRGLRVFFFVADKAAGSRIGSGAGSRCAGHHAIKGWVPSPRRSLPAAHSWAVATGSHPLPRHGFCKQNQSRTPARDGLCGGADP